MKGRSVKRILIVRQDKLGDLVATTPAIRALKEANPDLHITLWISPELEPVVRHNPSVDALAFTTSRPKGAMLWRHFGDLRRGRFDAVIFPRPRSGTHIPLAFLARIPIRVGSTEQWYGRFLTRNLALPWRDIDAHEAELIARIFDAFAAKALPRYPYFVALGPEDEAQADSLTASLGPYFCVHPGTGGTACPWPVDKYAEVARTLAEQTGMACVVTGTPTEQALAELLAKSVGRHAVNVAGKTSLLGLAAILKRASLVIAGSTGPMHLASSQQTPAVLLEPTPDAAERVVKWRPYLSPHRAVAATRSCEGCDRVQCHQTGRECVDSIVVEDVVAQALDLLRECQVAAGPTRR